MARLFRVRAAPGTPRLIMVAALIAAADGVVRAEPAVPGQMTLEEAVTFAVAHHPSLRGRAALERGADARAEAARADYLPDLELTLQLNRATGNVVPGSLFAMRGIPATSGPPKGRTFDEGVFGTAAGIGLAWDAVGFKRRIALVDAALEEHNRVRAGTGVRQLEVGFAAADRFLQTLLRGEAVKAARASVERARVFSATVKRPRWRASSSPTTSTTSSTSPASSTSSRTRSRAWRCSSCTSIPALTSRSPWRR